MIEEGRGEPEAAMQADYAAWCKEMNTNGRKQQKDLLGRFGSYLHKRRKHELNLSIRAFAERARLPHSSVHQMEKYRKDPNLTELEMLAKAFNEPLGDFLQPVLQRRAKQ